MMTFASEFQSYIFTTWTHTDFLSSDKVDFLRWLVSSDRGAFWLSKSLAQLMQVYVTVTSGSRNQEEFKVVWHPQAQW